MPTAGLSGLGNRGGDPMVTAPKAQPYELTNLIEDQKQVSSDGQSNASHLYKSPNGNLTVRAVVFPEGKPTPVHDHLTWGMVGVYEGVERENRYHRIDDGSRAGYAELVHDSVTDYPAGQ